MAESGSLNAGKKPQSDGTSGFSSLGLAFWADGTMGVTVRPSEGPGGGIDFPK